MAALGYTAPGGLVAVGAGRSRGVRPCEGKDRGMVQGGPPPIGYCTGSTQVSRSNNSSLPLLWQQLGSRQHQQRKAVPRRLTGATEQYLL